MSECLLCGHHPFDINESNDDYGDGFSDGIESAQEQITALRAVLADALARLNRYEPNPAKLNHGTVIALK